MLLSHYSGDKKDSSFPNTLSNCPDHDGHKPGGLWVGDEESGEGWKALALERREKSPEQWKYHPKYGDIKDNLRFRYDFRIRPEQNGHIVILRDVPALARFTEEYMEVQPRSCEVDGVSQFGLHINWKRVKQRFKGIIITPHQREARQRDKVKYHWYKFDCASGCFWNASCLELVSSAGPLF